jgi:hypothetical protein
MIGRRHRLAATFLAIGLLAATLYAVDALALPSPAEARCTGVGNPVRSTFSYPVSVAASETPVTGTCNGNQLYSGVLKDERADGYCVSVWFQEAGLGWVRASSILCGNGNTSSFEWRDRNGNSYMYEQFCVHRASDHALLACGWGTGIGEQYYGVNQGF